MANKKSLKINILLIVLYALITLCIVFRHEIWSDEAQAWLIARDLDFWGIIKTVRYEGHPLLWYFSIFPLAKAGFSVFSMQILSWLITLCGAAIFVLFSPFSTITGGLFLAGAGMLYYTPAYARSYCLFPALIFLLAMIFPKRAKHPYIFVLLLLLILNTHIILGGFCTALAILFIYEGFFDKNSGLYRKKEFFIASGLVFLGFLLLFFYLHGMTDTNTFIGSYTGTWFGAFRAIARTTMGTFGFEYCIFLFWAVAAVYFWQKNKKLLFVFLASLVYQVFVYKFIWGAIPQRGFSLLLVLVFCFWAELAGKPANPGENRFVSRFLSLFFLLTVSLSVISIKDDWLFNYSDGKNIANFIKNEIPSDAIIISAYDNNLTSVLAYLPERRFLSFNKGKEFTYFHYDDKISGANSLKITPDFYEKPVYIITPTGPFFETKIKHIKKQKIYESDENILSTDAVKIYRAYFERRADER